MTTGSRYIFRNSSFSILHIITDRTLFLVLSFLMRVVVSVGEASIVPSAIAIGSVIFKTSYNIQLNKLILTSFFNSGSKSFVDHEGLTMSSVDTSYTLGLMLGASLGGLLFDVAGVFLPFLVSGIMAACLALAALKLK